MDFILIVNVDKAVHSIMYEAKNRDLEGPCLALSQGNKRGILVSDLSHLGEEGFFAVSQSTK